MGTNSLLKRDLSTIPVKKLKQYAYSISIAFGLVSMGTVLLFGSPTFSLSPATERFDAYVYPLLMGMGSLLIWLLLTDRVQVDRFEKPVVGVFSLFVVTKYAFTLLTAPTLLPLHYMESWYWMMIGAWIFSFLAFPFMQGLLINLTIYILMIGTAVLHLWTHVPRALFADELLDVLTSNFRLSAALGLLIILGYIKDQWVVVEQEAIVLRDMARIDALTQLPNRRHLNETLARLASSSEPVTVILFDLDGFKQVNDTFGHAMGDEILARVGQLTTAVTRDKDTLGRWGGEEFLVICPDTTVTEGLKLAERLRKTIATLQTDAAGTITASFGVAERRSGETPDRLVVRADRALYDAKERGKNLVEACAEGA